MTSTRHHLSLLLFLTLGGAACGGAGGDAVDASSGAAGAGNQQDAIRSGGGGGIRILESTACDERFQGDALRDELAAASEGLFCLRWRTAGETVRIDAYNMAVAGLEDLGSWSATLEDGDGTGHRIRLSSSSCFEEGRIDPPPCRIDMALEVDIADLAVDDDDRVGLNAWSEYCGLSYPTDMLLSVLDLSEPEGMRCRRHVRGTKAPTSRGRIEAACRDDLSCDPGLECVQFQQDLGPLCWSPCERDDDCGLGGAESCVEGHCRLIGNFGN